MSELRLSELLPHERWSPEVVHSYTGPRMSGSISDRLVSDNFSGNATHIHFSAFEFFKRKINATYNLLEHPETIQCSLIILAILPKSAPFSRSHLTLFKLFS